MQHIPFDDDELEALLDQITAPVVAAKVVEESAATASEVEPVASKRVLHPTLRAALDHFRSKLASEFALNRSQVRENWRRRTRAGEREIYAFEKKQLGIDVRPRRRFCATTPEALEKLADLKRREHREGQRRRRGKSAETVRSYTDCTSMSDAERQAHDRSLAAERSRQYRLRKKDTKS
ncbi:hypothetical protein EMQ25_17760 [Arsenicitalea aurantiaca]|uniref:Uncharacterized protein n=1 Tax=Arsenicitalea aurantiaca TaxID=1783274 RepID=A0A433X2I8_9HYPH|nr:hypothetical protein [Arsenicitalea aurantiaca]RUT28240.1 hypothetical protein EMQ25_17760 [Arsenicitalea aurantiaca]